VIPPLCYALNQLAAIFVWQFSINGLPIPAMICPMIAKKNPELTNILRIVPRIQNAHPIKIPILAPYVSMKKAAGKVNRGCIRINMSPVMLITIGSC